MRSGPRVAAAVVAATLGIASTAHGHGIGMSQLSLRADGARFAGTWEVPLRDARLALGLDPSAVGEPAWQDVRSHRPSLGDYLGSRVALTGDGAPCTPGADAPAPLWQPDLGMVRVDLVFACASAPAHLAIHCDLLFDADPAHRAYFSVVDDRGTHLGVLREDRRSATVDVRYFGIGAGFVEFVREGIAHIWTGVDHLLFLLTLLLCAPVSRAGNGWAPRGGLGETAREALKVVTAFTVAHSVTLCLSFFGFVAIPARWTETGIAVSVFAAAWNNVRPFLPTRAWVMALAFGLVHGLGFAGALRNLALPTHARGLALAAFNVGVELGQLAIVAVVLPLLYLASRRRAYPRLALGASSLGIAWLAAMWTIERAFGVSLLPGL